MIYLVYELFYDWVAFYGVYDTEEAAILRLKEIKSEKTDSGVEIRSFVLNEGYGA